MNMFTLNTIFGCSLIVKNKLVLLLVSLIMESCISVDGSLYEGGGQIIRLSLALSIICQKPVNIINIRSGRSRPGLAESHLTSVNILASISDSQVQGNFKGSTSLNFAPGKAKSGNYKAICNTAGSTNLILQAVLPVLMSTSSNLVITGGTDTDFSPTSFHVTNMLQPALQKLGINCEIFVDKYGFYPKGGGKIILKTQPSRPSSLNLTNTEYFDFGCSVLITGKGRNSQKLNEICTQITENLQIPLEKIQTKIVQSQDHAIVASLFCNTGFVPMQYSFIENFRNSSYDINEICNELKQEIALGHTIDQYLQDQIIIFLALAQEPSSFFTKTLTPHTQAVIYLIHLFQLAEIQHENSILTIRPIN